MYVIRELEAYFIDNLFEIINLACFDGIFTTIVVKLVVFLITLLRTAYGI